LARGTFRGRLVTAGKAAACIVFVGHMAATCTQHIPERSALRPLAAPFYRYEELTGIWQSWNMFTTPPYLHTYDVDVEVTEPDGTSGAVGPMLPGVRPFDHTLRAESFFTCVVDDPSCVYYARDYVVRMCSELRARLGHGGQDIVIHEAFERLRLLPDIRANGVIGTREDHRSKPFACGG
jgi:hypothetical protein